MIEERNSDRGIDGVVRESVSGGPDGVTKIVKSETVYNPVFGGPDQIVGHVKNGVAYDFTFGGPDRIIGTVESF